MTSPLKQDSEEKSVRVPVPDELYELVLEAAQKAGVSTEEFLRFVKSSSKSLSSIRNTHPEPSPRSCSKIL